MDDWFSQCRIDLQKIILNSTHKRTLKTHADNEKPNESCAILFGKIRNDVSYVKEVFLAENSEQSPSNFTISNKQLLEAYEFAEKKELDVVGIFHSHPSTEAIPSSTDEKFMEANPVVWVIFSCVSGDLRAYSLDSKINEIPIE